MATFLAILNALAAIPKIAAYVEDFAAAITGWYVGRQTSKTLSAIADAAAFAARAESQEDRYASLAKWNEVLSRTRYIS